MTANNNNNNNNEAHVLVAGAGPVGLFVALILARNGIKVTVVEAEAQIDSAPRAMAFQPPALAEMVEAQVYDDVHEVSVKTAIISWWKGGLGPGKKHIATITTSDGDSSQSFLSGLNCSQADFAKILIQHLLKYSNVKVLFGHRLVSIKTRDPTAVEATIEHDGTRFTMKASWLVGADGGRSSCRTFLGIKFQGFTWPKEEFVATNVYYPFDSYGFTNRNMILDPVNWAVVAKIQNDGLWRVAYGTAPGKTKAEIEDELPERYKSILPGPGTGYKVTQVNKYRPHQRCAARFREGRVLLVGDAAHLNNPIGGLGLTTGILDAGPLARALSAVINGVAPEKLLDEWDKRRRATWWEQTNKQSIAFKRIAQQGGYSQDPFGIWEHDEVAEQHGMTEYLVDAVSEAQQKDEALYESLKVLKNQQGMRARVWGLALPPDWMAEYEARDVVERRRSIRPQEVPALGN